MQKYNEINPEKILKKKQTNVPLIEEEVKKGKSISKNTRASVMARPSIRQSKKDQSTNLILRDIDQIEKF